MILSKDNARRDIGKRLNANRYAWCARGKEVDRNFLQQLAASAKDCKGYAEKLAAAQARKEREQWK